MSPIPGNATLSEAFPHNWRVEIQTKPIMIAPPRHFVYPLQVPGEEATLARGAFQLMVYPAGEEPYLATCALGFTDPAMPTAVYACPNPQEICAVAGGYAYIANTTQPKACTHIALKPVVEVRVLEAQNLLLFIGFHAIAAWGPHGLAWQSTRLSWEGVRITGIEDTTLHGTGWNLMTDKDVPFTLDLLTGQHQGGGFEPPPGMPPGIPPGTKKS